MIEGFTVHVVGQRLGVGLLTQGRRCMNLSVIDEEEIGSEDLYDLDEGEGVEEEEEVQEDD